MDLTINTIIVAILVILVLVLVASFFLFGFRGVTEKIKATFFGITAGTDRTLAVQSCRNYCTQAELLPESMRGTSAYCKTYFYIDEDNDGEAEKSGNEFKKFYCWDLGITCTFKEGRNLNQAAC